MTRANALGFVGRYSPHKPSSRIIRETIRVHELRPFSSMVARATNRFRTKSRAEPLTEVSPGFFVGGAVDAFEHSSDVAIICMLEDVEPMHKNRENVLWLPTPDYYSPTLPQLWAARDFAVKNDSKKLIVCCDSGKGRSVICACYLLCHAKKITLDDAFSEISKKRPTITQIKNRRGGVKKQWKLVKTMVQHE